MFEVTSYVYPHIFVTRHRTGEIFKFSIRGDGTLTHPEARVDQGEARRAAVAWLTQRMQVKELEVA